MRYIHIKNNKIEIIESKREESEIRKIKNWNGVLIQSELPISELVDNGDIIVPDGMKLQDENFVFMTDKERYESGVLSKKDYTEIVIKERQRRYTKECDHLFMENVFNEIENGESRDCSSWINAVKKIKTELPKP